MEKKVYFDCAATTPLKDSVLREILPYFSEKYGNPGSLHFWGQEAQAAVDSSRLKISSFFKVDPENVLFFSSATEINNFVFNSFVGKFNFQPHFLISPLEHNSVLKVCESLWQAKKIDLDYIKIDKNGDLDLKDFTEKINQRTVLVSVMGVNNETGAIAPLKEISRIIKSFRQEKLRLKNQAKFSPEDLLFPVFYSDFVQAVGHKNFSDLSVLGVDLICFSGHKIYGPKGAAALVSNLSVPLTNILPSWLLGGSQEFGFRAGTENIPAIVGLAKALEVIDFDEKKMFREKGTLIDFIKKIYPRVLINSPAESVSNIINLSFLGYLSEELIYLFDRQGVAVSAGSACDAKSVEVSHVLKGMGFAEDRLSSAIRISFGSQTEKQEFDLLYSALEKIFS